MIQKMKLLCFCNSLLVIFQVGYGQVQPPGAITIRARTSTAVTFSFISSPTDGASYEATFTSERSGISQLGPISFTNTFYSASGLIPDVDYALSIVAISGGGRSTPVTVDVTTLPAIPNGPPQGVTQESSTSTSITLTWNDPAPQKINDRDGITGFRLFQGNQSVANVTTRRYQFTGLSPGIEYTFKILAVNEQGPAPDRHAASFTGRTAPGVPAPPTFRVILPRFFLAFLIWREPVPYVGEITKYNINYTVDSVRLNVPQQSGTTKSYTINNINDHIGKTHAVSIRASTASGWGDFSEPVEFVFQPIVNVSIQPVDCSTVAVDYTIQPLPGEDNAAQLDQFVLSYHKTTGSSATIELSEDISANSSGGRVYVHNLEKDTFYDFRYNVDVTLTGISVTPPGDFPRDITYRIPNDCGVPAPPTFRVILPRFSLAFLIWSEPEPYVGEITRYDINYTVDGVRLNVPQQSGTTKSYTINNINDHIGKTHAVSIRARTASGWGDFSEPVEFVFQPIVDVSIQHVNCSTVAVDYVIQPLPGEDNAAQLDQFVLSYHKTTGSSDTIELSEDISTNTSSGTIYVHNLEKDTFYDFRYSVNVTLTGISVTPPGDFPADITYRIIVDTPSQKSPTPSQNSPATVIILLVVAAVIIMILLVIITILSVLLILKRNKQPPTVHCDQVNMSEIYYEADIMKTNQDYQELDVSQMDDDVMTSSKDYQKLNVRKMDPLDDEVINKKGNIGLEAIKKEDVIFAKKTMKN